MCACKCHLYSEFKKTAAFSCWFLAFRSLLETFSGVWLFSQQFLFTLKLKKVRDMALPASTSLGSSSVRLREVLNFHIYKEFLREQLWMTHQMAFPQREVFLQKTASETVARHLSIFTKCHILCLHLCLWSIRIALPHSFQTFEDSVRLHIFFSGLLLFF